MRRILLSLLLIFVSHFYVSMFAETKKWSDISRDSVIFYKNQAKLSESIDKYAYYICAQTRHMIKLGDYIGAYKLVDSLYSTKYIDIQDVKTKANVLSTMATCLDGIGCYQNAVAAEYQTIQLLKTDANNNAVAIVRELKNLCLRSAEILYIHLIGVFLVIYVIRSKKLREVGISARRKNYR